MNESIVEILLNKPIWWQLNVTSQFVDHIIQSTLLQIQQNIELSKHINGPARMKIGSSPMKKKQFHGAVMKV